MAADDARTALALPRLVSALLACWRRLRLRSELRRLRETSGHLLADVGLDTAQTDREIFRHFWQPTTIGGGAPHVASHRLEAVASRHDGRACPSTRAGMAN